MSAVAAAVRVPCPADYPAYLPEGERLRFLLGYAVLAPSAHNTQPWRWRLDGDTVELRADRTRALPVADPSDRELTISCGAALFFLRLAIRRFGRVDEVEIFPDPSDRDLLARVRLGAPILPHWEVEELFSAIGDRHTYRLEFDELEVHPRTARKLVDAAEAEGAWMELVERGEARHALAGLVREGDRTQFADPAFRHELASWVRGNRSSAPDGVPGYAFGIPDVVSALGPVVMGGVNLGAMWGGRSHQATENAPVLAVIGTDGDTPRDWLMAGQSLGRLLLAAAAEGISAGFLNQAVEVPALRDRVRSLLGGWGHPQLVLRFGYPREEARPTPRRSVEDVLED